MLPRSSCFQLSLPSNAVDGCGSFQEKYTFAEEGCQPQPCALHEMIYIWGKQRTPCQAIPPADRRDGWCHRKLIGGSRHNDVYLRGRDAFATGQSRQHMLPTRLNVLLFVTNIGCKRRAVRKAVSTFRDKSWAQASTEKPA